jgi:Ca2+-binding RTX toxin-like protein
MANITGTNGNDSLVGTSVADTIQGLDGNDTLVGNAGNDTLNGGNGNDRYVVGTGDVLVDSGGTDTIETSVTWHLAAGFENLIATGTASTSHGGNNLNNIITGNAGANWIAGREGDDTLLGGGGGDTFNMSNGAGASYGNDSIDGGTGIDTLDFGAAARTAVTVNLLDGTASGGGTGGAGSAALVSIENVNGSAFNDSVTGNEAANFLFGFDGNDTLDGGAGNDRLEGAAGNDQYVFSVAPGTPNADTVTGFASGADKIALDASVHVNLGASGNFVAGDARFAAGAGFTSGRDASDRVIYNTTTGQLFYDADGNGAGAAQLIATLQGAPALVGTDIAVENGSGGRLITGTPGDDSIDGTAGNDTIMGEGGADTIHGAGGDDWIDSGPAGEDVNWMFGDGGNDTLVGGADSDFLDGGADDDQMLGGDGDDNFRTGAGNDYLSGGAGRDNFDIFEFQTAGIRGYGNDTIDGGAGDLDEIFVKQIDALSVDLAAGTLTGGVPGTASIQNIERFFVWEADVFNDRLIGNASNNYLAAGGGDDTLDGGAGTDWIDGGTGNDLLTGGAGADNFRFQEAPGAANADRITDFASATDTIFLDGRAHQNIGGFGPFAAGDQRFYAAPGANTGHDATDRVVYDTSSGNLWYDADGDGAGAAQLIATLQPGAALAATDIMVENAPMPFFYQGGPENNHVIGTELNDTLNGGGGNDSLEGFAGDDQLNGEDGDDTLEGGAGADSISGGRGNDIMFAGLESVLGDSAADTLDGGLGDDTFHHVSTFDGDVVLPDAGGMDTVFAIGDHTLGGGLENLRFDDFFGGFWNGTGNELDNSIVSASEGGNLFGMGGNDVLVIANFEGFGSAHGGDGNDTLEAGRSSELFGDAGNDTLIAYAIGSTMSGGAGNDSFVFESAADARHQVEDFASGVDKIRLDATNMTELGASGNFAAGDARFHIGAAAHDADDRVIYNSTTAELFYDADGSGAGAAELIATLQAGATVVATDIAVDNGTAPGGATITGTTGNDNLTGTAGNDTINALAGEDRLSAVGGNDSLSGSTGHDTLLGGDGNDTLNGGGWSDNLTGGAGADSFFYAEAGSNQTDQVTDFVSGTDELLFENGTLTALGAAGAWAAGDARFWAAAGAASGHDANDRIVYNTSTGALYYDADGSGAGAAQIIATFTGAPGITSTDITVI